MTRTRRAGKGRRAEPGRVDLSDVAVVDGHCHPLVRRFWALTPARFLDSFSESRPGTMRAHVAETLYARRALRELAGMLGAGPTPEAILARRRARGPSGARRAFSGARVSALLVDTGYPPDAMPLGTMGRVLDCQVHEVVRIERLAENLIPRHRSWPRFRTAFRDTLTRAAARAVAFKSIIAYRSGLAVRARPLAELQAGYARACVQAAGGRVRLTEPAVLDTLFLDSLAIARATRRPLQIHTGFGDPDIDLLRATPLLLRPILEDPQWADVRLVLLHLAYPFSREAAFMAAVWPQVYVDLSLAPVFLGPGVVPALVEALALAPATKLLYGSDVTGWPELYALAARWTRAALGEALGWHVARDALTPAEARRAGRLILADNARALYRLPPAD